jgi:hypothetical protein
MAGARSNNEIIRRRSTGRNRRGQGAKSLTVKLQAGFNSLIVSVQCGKGDLSAAGKGTLRHPDIGTRCHRLRPQLK